MENCLAACFAVQLKSHRVRWSETVSASWQVTGTATVDRSKAPPTTWAAVEKPTQVHEQSVKNNNPCPDQGANYKGFCNACPEGSIRDEARKHAKSKDNRKKKGDQGQGILILHEETSSVVQPFVVLRIGKTGQTRGIA